MLPPRLTGSRRSSCAQPKRRKDYSSMAELNVAEKSSIMASVILGVLFILNGRGPKLSLGTGIINRREYLLVVGRI